jgi:hypothetical protein
VAACHAGPCAHPGPTLLSRLGAAIRRCPHGVLIRTRCLLLAPRCRADPAAESGAYLLVQPCRPNREPQGSAIGPLLSTGDREAVATWLEAGELDLTRLDPRLRIDPRVVQRAHTHPK